MMVRTRVVAAVGAAVAVGVVAFASTAASQTARPAADDPNNASLTYWYWGEDDAPGANGWLKKQVALYEKAHPKVKITVVTQSTDTLTSAFTTAAQTKSGPDIATQWATLPVLTPAWNGSSVADLRLRARSRDQELDRHAPRTCPAASSGRCRSTCSASPSSGTRRCSRRRGSNPNKGPKTWAQFLADAKKLKAAGITPFGMGNKDGYGGAWFFSLIGKQNLNSIDELKAAMIGKAKFSEPKYLGVLPGARRPEEEGLPQLGRRLDQLHPGSAALRPEESRHVLDHGRLRRCRREDARWDERHGCRADPDLG